MSGLSGNEAELRATSRPIRRTPSCDSRLGRALAAKADYPAALEHFMPPRSATGAVQGKVKELMVRLFHMIGVRSELAEEYRNKLSAVMY